MAGTISSLPNELMVEVCKHLTTSHSPRQLCLVSRWFRDHAQRFVYEHIVIHSNHDRSIFLLLRTLHREPRLARFIKSFRYRPPHPDNTQSEDSWEGDEFGHVSLEEEEEETNVEAHSTGGSGGSEHDDEEGLGNVLPGGTERIDAIMARILSKCENLHTLGITINYSRLIQTGDMDMDELLMHGLRFTSVVHHGTYMAPVAPSLTYDHNFEKLKVVRLCHTFSYQMAQAKPFFYLPNLQELRIHRLRSKGMSLANTSRTTILWHPNRPRSPITRLGLFETAISAIDLGEILQACPSLKTLAIRFSEDRRIQVIPYSAALSFVSATLEHLQLSTTPLCFAYDYGFLGAINLTHFSRLDSVEIPIQFLNADSPGSIQVRDDYSPGSYYLTPASSCLPMAVRRIRFEFNLAQENIEWYSSWLSRYISELCDQSIFSQLKEIRLVYWGFPDFIKVPFQAELDDRNKDLIELCARPGTDGTGITMVVERKRKLYNPPRWCSNQPCGSQIPLGVGGNIDNCLHDVGHPVTGPRVVCLNACQLQSQVPGLGECAPAA